MLRLCQRISQGWVVSLRFLTIVFVSFTLIHAAAYVSLEDMLMPGNLGQVLEPISPHPCVRELSNLSGLTYCIQDILECPSDQMTASFSLLASIIRSQRHPESHLTSDVLQMLLYDHRGHPCIAAIIDLVAPHIVANFFSPTHRNRVDDILKTGVTMPNYNWIPVHYFSVSADNARNVFCHFIQTRSLPQGNYFLKELTDDQFMAVISFPAFHFGLLSLDALNAFNEAGLPFLPDNVRAKIRAINLPFLKKLAESDPFCSLNQSVAQYLSLECAEYIGNRSVQPAEVATFEEFDYGPFFDFNVY